MEIISNHADKHVKKDERYYLTLYRHTLRVVRGQPVETAMQDEVKDKIEAHNYSIDEALIDKSRTVPPAALSATEEPQSTATQ